MMAEVLRRRFSREWRTIGSSGETPRSRRPRRLPAMTSFSARPDLIVVDGGAGQVSAAAGALAAAGHQGYPGDRSGQAFRGDLSLRASPSAYGLPDDSPALSLLKRIRDEAHRFAITFHRQRRDRAMTGSHPRRPPRHRAGPQEGHPGAFWFAGAVSCRQPRRAGGGAGTAGQDSQGGVCLCPQIRTDSGGLSYRSPFGQGILVWQRRSAGRAPAAGFRSNGSLRARATTSEPQPEKYARPSS